MSRSKITTKQFEALINWPSICPLERMVMGHCVIPNFIEH